MKTIILAAMLAAQPATDFNEENNWTEYCASIGDTAEAFMRSNQLGVPLSEMMGLIDQHATDADGRALFREILMEAYRQTPMQAERNATRQQSQFRNRWELMCWELEGER